MFDYARKLQLAASDLGRRVGLKAVAGVLAAIAAGFLIAALWTFLARTLDWGPLWASLVVGLLFAAIAGVLLAISNKVKHPIPSTEELKREVEARASLATEAALDRAKEKAREVVDMAENKVHGLIDTASYKASSLVGDAEARAQKFANTTVSRAVHSVGLDSGVVDDVKAVVSDFRASRAAPAAGVLGAFAVGLALAARLGGRGGDSREDWSDDDWADEDWSDDWRDDAAREWADADFDEEYRGA